MTETKLADGSVTNTKLGAGSVSADKLDPMGAAAGQVLKWNGTMWAAADDLDADTTYSAGTAITIDGLNTISVDPDILVITVTDATGGTLVPGSGVTIIEDGADDLRSAAGPGPASTSAGTVLGDWGTPTPVFINEIHYDNEGSDKNEEVEIAGPAGTNLASWSVVFYDGGDKGQYHTKSLTGTIADDTGNGFGTLSFVPTSFQNDMDGLALVDNNGKVIQFLSYEGSFTALDGPAAGMTSVDIGVQENDPGTADTNSLQFAGTGKYYEDFTWQPDAASSFGAVNTGVGQVFSP